MKRFIFLCIRYRIRIFAKIYHSLVLIKAIFKNRGNLSFRSPVLFNRATTFVPYIQSQAWMEDVKKNLSENDKMFLQTILDKILYIAYNNVVDYRKLYTADDEKEQQKYLQYFYKQPQTNYFKKHGYGLMNEYCINRDVQGLPLQCDGKDILDCGAYIGDSAISFSNNFPNSKVYAFEPDTSNFEQLKKVISLHSKDNTIIPVNIGVGEHTMEGFLSNEGIGSKISDSGTKIHIKTIDSFVQENNLNPGLIKRDIEGFEYFSILGALETLKKYKPILLISVYHHGRDLFETKKLLQDLQLGYKYTFTRWDSMTAFSDTLLVCY